MKSTGNPWLSNQSSDGLSGDDKIVARTIGMDRATLGNKISTILVTYMVCIIHGYTDAFYMITYLIPTFHSSG
jgi:hypothetical protein